MTERVVDWMRRVVAEVEGEFGTDPLDALMVDEIIIDRLIADLPSRPDAEDVTQRVRDLGLTEALHTLVRCEWRVLPGGKS